MQHEQEKTWTSSGMVISSLIAMLLLLLMGSCQHGRPERKLLPEATVVMREDMPQQFVLKKTSDNEPLIYALDTLIFMENQNMNMVKLSFPRGDRDTILFKLVQDGSSLLPYYVKAITSVKMQGIIVDITSGRGDVFKRGYDVVYDGTKIVVVIMWDQASLGRSFDFIEQLWSLPMISVSLTRDKAYQWDCFSNITDQ